LLWPSVTIGDLCRSGDVELQTGPFGSQLHSYDYLSEGVPVVPTEAIANGRLDHAVLPKISAAKAASLERHRLRVRDILFARRGVQATGKTAIIRRHEEGFICGTGAIRLRVRAGSTKVDADFLSCLLMDQASVDWFKFHAIGATMPNLNEGIIKAFGFQLPPLPEQRAIAATLGVLDDKIELNRRMNATLESMARALFRDWFVDFGPTRAKAAGHAPYLSPDLWSLFPDRLDDDGKPQGWEVRSVYDFASVVYGAPFASKKFNSDGNGRPLIRIRDLATHEPGVWTDEDHPKGHIIQPGDLVVGMDGEFRLHVWKGAPAWLNQRVCHFEPLPGVPSSFLAEALIEPLAFFERGKVGTTVIHLGKGDIDTFQLLHPGNKLLEAFGSITQTLIEATVRNAIESRTLAQTRDLLLPRLMSGELRVADVDQGLEAVL
jgi:type I restriction enzyme S subunit